MTKDKLKKHFGKLIVLEGIDACGKETQTNLLVKNLKKAGRKTIKFSFPDYRTESGQKIKEMLNTPNLAASNPKTNGFAELFALNFSEKKEKIENYLKRGFIVICDRYEPSNEAYQSAKLSRKEQGNFRKYIQELCFKKYKIPKPDLMIFLDLPPALCEVLKKNRKEKDAYEKNFPFLEKVYKQYQKIAKEKNWVSVKCYKNEAKEQSCGVSRNPKSEAGTKWKIFSKEKISEKVWLAAKTVLNF